MYEIIEGAGLLIFLRETRVLSKVGKFSTCERTKHLFSGHHLS